MADACSLVTDGTHYTPKTIEQGIPFITVKNISAKGIDFAGASRISQDDFEAARAGNSAPQPGDVLFSKDGTVGKVHVVESSEPFAVLSSIAILRPKANVNSRYLGHVLQTPEVLAQAVSRKTGSGVPRIILSDLRRVEVPLPPLEEQRRVAAILDRADAIRANRRQALAQLEELARSIFQIMFASEADYTTVSDVATETRTGPFGSQLRHGEFAESGVAVLGLDNVVGNRFRWAERRYITPAKYMQLQRYTVHPGDVLISIMGTTGRCVVVPEDMPVAINTKHICAITVDREQIDPQFLRAAFLWDAKAQAHLRQRTKGSIMNGLNMGIIKAMPVPVPTLARQLEFKQRLEAIESLRARHEQALTADDDLFFSLQALAFRGEL